MTGEDWKEYWACLALRHTRGVGLKTCARLLESYGEALAAVDDVDSWVRRGLATREQAGSFLAQTWQEGALEEWRAVRDRGCSILLQSRAEYPLLLRRTADPPLLLYHRGEAALLANPGVAVVGSRNCTRLGKHLAETISRGLSKAGVTVISGLAYGIDREAHLGGLAGPGGSIAVLGAGLDAAYPSGNQDLRLELERKGLVVTEYAPGVGPEPRNFPVRNRIISGLSLGVVVVEAAERSGALITARYALEQNREVFAVPGPGGGSSHAGCHRLINEGARLVGGAEEILAELLPQLAERLRNGELGQGRRTGPNQEQETLLPLPGRKRRLTLPPDLAGDCPDPGARKPAPSAAKAPAPTPRQEPGVSGEEREVLGALEGERRMHVDALGEALGWDAGRVSRVLLLLEVRGLVRQFPGMIYAAAEPHPAA